MSETIAPRKKITIRMPVYKPDPEEPLRYCRVCREMHAAWRFDDTQHPDICTQCILWPMPRMAEYRTGMTRADRGMALSAESVIRRLIRGA